MKYFRLFIILLSAAASFAACETMEDTYAEYDKNQRFVGQCDSVEVHVGWERFKLTWVNSSDPTIDHIMIEWEQDTVVGSVELPVGTTEYETDTIFKQSSKSCEFMVYAVDSEGNKSNSDPIYAKPVSRDDELVMLMGTVNRNHYYIGNELVILLQIGRYKGEYDEAGIVESYITYTKVGGETVKQEITADDYNFGMLEINDIAEDSRALVQSKILLEDCYDTIKYEPYILYRIGDTYTDDEGREITVKANYDADFVNTQVIRFDLPDNVIRESVLDTLTELHISTDVSALTNVLYMPNLKRIILGGERYMNRQFSNNDDYVSKLDDINSSVFALETLYKVNGVEIQIYGNHYQIKDSLNIRYLSTNPRSYPIAAEKLNMSDWTITANYDQDISSSLDNLIDANFQTAWKSLEVYDEVRTHEIIYDMQEEIELKGFYFSQYLDQTALRNPTLMAKYLSVFPQFAEIEISSDGVNWSDPFENFQTFNLGITMAENTVFKIPQDGRALVKARYVKLIVNDRVTSTNNYVVLGDFFPF
ncbi:MAG: DUF4998 domain-containing protein [Mangrovibacterium sp.]